MKATVNGLYAVTPDLSDTALLLKHTRAALIGGACWVQYRNKIADQSLRGTQAAALCELCRRHGAMLIVNDYVDLAREIDADGVHVGADDGTIADARARLGHGKIIGASCYNDLTRAHDAVAYGADYVAFGSFFASSVKPGAVRAPLALLREARLRLELPVVAIGGITLANAPQLIAAGADAIAVISALYAAPDVEIAAREFTRLFEVEAA